MVEVKLATFDEEHELQEQLAETTAQQLPQAWAPLIV